MPARIKRHGYKIHTRFRKEKVSVILIRFAGRREAGTGRCKAELALITATRFVNARQEAALFKLRKSSHRGKGAMAVERRYESSSA